MFRKRSLPVLVAVALVSGSYTLWLILAGLATAAAAAAYRALDRTAGKRDGVAGAEVTPVEMAAA